ncbi:MAG: DUF2914 domain-containing protein [Myxococcales bacterium]|nr:DUF2914 domain-containing protein [Myxococcales bacterium]
MPLSLPKSRPERPRRRVEPVDAPLRDLPLRTYSFDPNAARQAWRQVARTRGAHAMRLDGRDSGSRLVPLALGLAVVIAVVLWWTSGDDAGPAEPGPVTVAAATPSGLSETPRGGEDGLAPEPEPMVRPGPAGASTFSEPVDDVAPAPPPPRIDRLPPPGTPEHHVRALEKLPHSSSDRAPIGGIGPEGMHVDRITMGTGYRDGACTGPVGKFSVRTEKIAHVCFRVVHPRTVQRVIVHWEREGRLVRRTFVQIGSTHGYRTRAALSLRRRAKGRWKARVMSTDGVELASHAFEIL